MIHMAKAITVNGSREAAYGFWREPANLARIMAPFADVRFTAPLQSHWKLDASWLPELEWDSLIIGELPGSFLRWRSADGAPLPNEGEVSFLPAPADWGTETRLKLAFDPPAGALGEKLAEKLALVPEGMALKALRRFKSLLETGEIPTLDQNPSAKH
jgi:uncharacterized membrane protein